MAEVGVKYTVTIQKQGSGAAEAAAELNTLAKAAQTANAAMGSNAAVGLMAVDKATKSATAGLKAMQGTLTLVGLQAFPQLTLAATTAQNALQGVKAAATAMGTSAAAAGGQFAVIAAGVYAVVRAGSELRKLLSTVKGESAGQLSLQSSAMANADRFRKFMLSEIDAGRLSLSEFESTRFDELLSNPTYERVRAMQDLVRSRLPRGAFMQDSEAASEVRERLSAQQRSFAFTQAQLDLNFPNGVDRLQQRTDIQVRYNDELKLQNQILKEGLITEEQFSAMAMESDTHRMQSLARLNAQLTETQRLAQDIAQNFAGSLASALVNTFREGSIALREFASQFLAQTAQMIAQLVIIRTLRTAFPALGLASGGVIFAANGLAGVSEVSSATYFPRFNVVAGEAGREMMTVLARPRFMEIGGMQAVVGNAGPSRLAITDANELAARGGAGGAMDIRIHLDPGLRADIVSNSIEGAVVRVTTEMGRDSKLSRATKQL